MGDVFVAHGKHVEAGGHRPMASRMASLLALVGGLITLIEMVA
ncbi:MULTISPECIES: hypothetical protein [unclassified Nonomuraea]|nr:MULTISPECIES: hypothetical protein [unclassified Nonomuraea]